MAEAKIKVAQQFIKDSPPGEFHEVINDLRVLVNDDARLQAGTYGAMKEYNTSQFIEVNLRAPSTGEKVESIVSSFGELDGGSSYFDPSLKLKFSFDHVLQTASDITEYLEVGPNEELRLAVQKDLEGYVRDHYPDGTCVVYDYDNQIVVCIASNKYNPSNFWNGRWCSQWNFSIESGKISGSMRVCVHYYEDGNVQLNTSKNETQSLATDGQSTAVIATKLKQIVKEFETKFQSALNENYARMSDTTFKGMRRALPVTKSKLDWAKISSYKIGHNISR